mmetsp:Transcript_3259/g.9842  ORF Transcript_3259/g.9842 Transcript_3259/m.9842 type:complete len:208 (+) Transcript_3259:166-789(+)
MADASKKPRMVVRLLMIGDSSVGKTSLVVRYDEDAFSTKYMTTIGVDYRDKFVELEGQAVKLQIWDTAGQERFRSLTANFFGKADGFVVCFDVGARATFDHVRTWIADIDRHKRGDVDVALCGCKCDLPDEKREVTRDEAAALASEFGAAYYEASAKKGTNVDSAFEDLGTKVVRRKLAATSNDGVVNLVLKDGKGERKKRGCCGGG